LSASAVRWAECQLAGGYHWASHFANPTLLD
jgi:hypothetical protein